MNQKYGAGYWMGAAFCVALILAAIVLAVMGWGERGTGWALRVTARWSFLFFWLAYAGGAIAKLFGPPFGVLAQHGRDFGLSFAAAHLVHVALIVWLFYVSPHHPDLTNFATQFQCVGLIWVYVLAAFSTERLRTRVSGKFLRLLYAIGLEYIALVFFIDFVFSPAPPKPVLNISFNVLFLILCVLGSLLRWTAMVRSGRKAAHT